MADAYRQILDSVVSAVTGLATTGASVFESPARALDLGELPALVVRASEATVSQKWDSPDGDDHLEEHQLTVAIHTMALTLAQRDSSALEVKHALLNTARPGSARRYLNAEFSERSEGERMIYSISQAFQIEYTIVATAPDVVVA